MPLKVPDEAEDPEMWFFSFADMMSLLMGYFVLLYSMANPDEAKFKAMAKAITDSINQTAEPITGSPGEGTPGEEHWDENPDLKLSKESRAFQMLLSLLNLEEDDKALQKIEHAFATSQNQKTLKSGLNQELLKTLQADLKEPETTDPRLIFLIEMPTSSVFLPDSIKLNPTAFEGLKRIAGMLQRADLPYLLDIEVHTHVQPPPRRFDTNWEYSNAQATALARFLNSIGIPPRKLSIKAMGDSVPLLPSVDSHGEVIEEAIEKNQRIVWIAREPPSP